MINIYGPGPYISFISIVTGSIPEIGQYALSFLICVLLFKLTRCLPSRFAQKAARLLIPACQLCYVYSVSIKSEFVFSLSLALLITLQLKILGLLPFCAKDYLLIFCLTLFPARLFNNTSALMGNLWIFLILFCSLHTTAKISMKHLKGNHFSCYFLFIILSFSAYVLHLSCVFLPHVLKTGSYACSLMLTIITDLLFFFLAAVFIRLKFFEKLLRLNHFGKKYPDIEKYFPRFTGIILLLFILIFIPFTVLQLQNTLITLLIPFLCHAVLCAQLPFNVLLFKTAFYKDAATYRQWEQEGISAYYENLSSSLSDMQKIRHDIKNIFFTMGSFVNESDNQAMKDFFWKKIYPYSQKTIQKNELMEKLYQIPSEPLRAFLNLKISQAVEQKISIRLDICVIPEYFQAGIDIIDLTRILGILLDNAIEETSKIPDGIIEIGIKNNKTSCSYIIKNPLTPQTQQTGIHIGATTKGEGHGKGLVIVQQLLEQYHNAVLNTSINHYTYIQCLNINVVNPNIDE